MELIQPQQPHSVVIIDCDDDIDLEPIDVKSQKKDPPLLSHHVLCLKESRCPSFVWKLWQFYEQIRWKITTNKILLKRFLLPFVKNKYINICDIIIFICFVVFEIITFQMELQEKDYANTIDMKDSMRVIGIVSGRKSILYYGITFTLATRNSFWYILIGIPFERALFYHIWFARYAILLTWVHFILLLIYWSDIPIINENILISTNISGLMALICSTFIFLFSLSHFRRNHWEFFLKTHWIFFLGFFYFAIKHHEYIWYDTYWMQIGIYCWLFDILYRFYISILSPLVFSNSKLNVLSIELLTDDIIKIVLQKNNFHCIEGQYCFLCIPAINITEWHPFSISNYYLNSDNKTQIEFHIKVLGDWTNRLKEFAIKYGNNDDKMLIKWDKLKIFMEGPYGKTEIQIEKYNSIILVGGGIGITPIQTMFDHLMHYVQDNNITTIKCIHFLWIIRNPEYETIKEFNRIHWQSVKQIKNKNNFKQKINIKQTQIKTNYFFTKIKDNNKINTLKNTYDGIQFNRPKMGDIINEAKTYGKCGIFACGPVPMINDIKKRSMKQKIDCHTEKFHF